MIGRYAVLAVCGLLWSVIRSFAASTQPVAEVSLDTLVSFPVRGASPVFLSDDSVSLLLRNGLLRTSATVVVLRLAEGKLKTAAKAAAKASRSNDSDEIFAASGQRILVESPRSATLYSPDLREQWIVPMRETLLAPAFPRSGIIGEGDKSWAVIQLNPEMPIVRIGPGRLLAVSDEVVVVRGKTLFVSKPSTGALSVPSRFRQTQKGHPSRKLQGQAAFS